MTDSAPGATRGGSKLRRQALLATVALAIGLAIVTATGCWFQWNLARAASQTAEVAVPRTVLAHRIVSQAAKCFGWQAEFEAVHNDPDARQRALESWCEASRGLQRLLDRAAAGVPTEDTKEFAAWQDLSEQYRRQFLSGVGRVRAGQVKSWPDLRDCFVDARSTILAITARAEDVASREEAACEAGGRWLQQLISGLARLMTLRSIVAFLALLSAYLWLSRTILRRVATFSAAVDRFLGGNRAIRIACDADDELGALGRQFNEIAALLKMLPATEVDAGVAGQAETKLECNPARDQNPTCDGEIRLNGRILVAEDGPENQRLISLILERAGAQVKIVGNGMEVLQAVAPQASDLPVDETRPAPFDLILMDIGMPVMDGCETVRRLRQAGYTGLVIAVTGYTKRFGPNECLEAGFDDYIVKPVGYHSLLKALAKHAARLGDGPFVADIECDARKPGTQVLTPSEVIHAGPLPEERRVGN